MFSHEEKAHLAGIAMQAEIECYNAYFMQESAKILTEYARRHGSDALWNYLINASGCTYRLYLEFCLLLPSVKKEDISFKI